MPSDSLKSGFNLYPVPSFQDNTDTPHRDLPYDITYDLPSTKCLGTLRTMASASFSPAENRPLNPNVVFRPESPSSRAPSDSPHIGSDGVDDGSPRVFARFGFSFVSVLRVLAIAFTIALIVVEFKGRRWSPGPADVFIAFTILQLIWLILALLTQGYRRRRSGHGEGFTVDLGFVKCIFGRRRRSDYALEGPGLLAWMDDNGSKCSRVVLLLFTAVDIAFAAILLATGILASNNSYTWNYHDDTSIAVVAIFVGYVFLPRWGLDGHSLLQIGGY